MEEVWKIWNCYSIQARSIYQGDLKGADMILSVYEVEYAGTKRMIFAPDAKTAAMLAGGGSEPTYKPEACLIRKGAMTNYTIFRTNRGDLVFVMKTGEVTCDSSQ